MLRTKDIENELRESVKGYYAGDQRAARVGCLPSSEKFKRKPPIYIASFLVAYQKRLSIPEKYVRVLQDLKDVIAKIEAYYKGYEAGRGAARRETPLEKQKSHVKKYGKKFGPHYSLAYDIGHEDHVEKKRGRDDSSDEPPAKRQRHNPFAPTPSFDSKYNPQFFSQATLSFRFGMTHEAIAADIIEYDGLRI